MASPLSSSSKQACHLVEFEWGSTPSFKRYTNWDSDVDFGGGTFVATPNAEIEQSPNSGTIQDKGARLIVPTDDFTLWLSSGEPVGIVAMRIFEILTNDESRSARYRYSGRAVSCTRNYRGQEGVSMIEGSTLSSELNFASGSVASNQCVNVFAKAGCFKSLVGLTGTGTVTAIAEGVVTITGLPTFSGRHWKQGFVSRDGVEIPIRSWDDTVPTRFILTREPPSSWIGQTVKAVPGCDQTLAACQYWGNEAQFRGIGIKMPAYNPLIEQPA